MKQQIYFYKLYLFGKDNEEDYITLTQEQGQKLSMVLATDSTRKFILVGEDLINTSSIKKIIRQESKLFNIETQKEDMLEIRELSKEENDTQKMFNDFKGKKLLN